MAFTKGDPCDALKGTPAYDYCTRDDGDKAPDVPNGGTGGGGKGITDGASDHVQDLANWLIKKIEKLVAPGKTWAPRNATDDGLFAPFLWLGQHLAVTIFICVVVVCALSAWQGAPRLKQMGHSTGWTLVAVLGMATVPGAVMLLNKAVADAFTVAFDSNESTLFGTIKEDLQHGADSGNPLAILIIVAGLVVALGFACLVFMTRQLGILVFVCVSPLVLASLARGGDTEAVQKWAQRLLGLIFAPFALLLVSPFVNFAAGSLVVDAVLLVGADLVMLRMIFHGVPYFGPRLAQAARSMVESRTDNRLVRGLARAGVPDVYEQENSPRGPRLVPTPGRAMARDGDALLGAYGVKTRARPGRLTTNSVISQINHDAARTQQLMEVRRQARAARSTPASNPSNSTPPAPSSPPRPRPRPTSGGSAGGGSATP
ncbi:hypothetical protein ACFVZD_47085 [Streptomyces sp. NPDC058287]|uniref:hypothetical protein n=1 Tax=Streptomyces sp. NPDC058287 TaxID=3346423 RepID=UPI0036EEB36D